MSASEIPTYDLTIPRGSTRSWALALSKQVNGVRVPLNLALADTQLVFSAKAKQDDVAAAVEKSYAAAGTVAPASSAGGITANDPTNGGAILTLLPADTRNLPGVLYRYNLWSYDPSGDVVIAARGTLAIEQAIAV